MPIWLRRFTFHKLKEHYQKLNEEPNDDMGTQAQKIKEGKIDLPNHFKGQTGKRPPKY